MAAPPATRWVLLVALLTAPLITEADWQLTQGITVRESVTDNIDLDEQDRELAAITTITPAFRLATTGGRGALSFNYRPSLQLFAGGSRSPWRSYHSLSADGRAELVEERFWVNSDLGIGQRAVSSTGNRVNDELSEDQETFRRWSIGPELRLIPGGRFRFDADAKFTTSELGRSDGDGDSEEAQLKIGMAPPPGDRSRFGWNLSIDLQNRTGGSRSTQRQEANLNLSYLLRDHWSLLGFVGIDDDNVAIDDNTRESGTVWGIGAGWRPSQRFSAQLLAGNTLRAALAVNPSRRSQLALTWSDRRTGGRDGNSWSLSAQHLARRSTWRASYREEITTTARLLPELVPLQDEEGNLVLDNVPDGLTLADIFFVDGVATAFSDEFGSFDREFLRRILELSVTFQLRRTGLSITLSDDRREIAEQFELLNDSDQRLLTLSLDLSRSIGGRSRISLNNRWQTRSAGGDEEFERLTSTLTFQRELSSRSRVDLSLQHRNQSGRDDRDDSYRENRISAALTSRF